MDTFDEVLNGEEDMLISELNGALEDEYDPAERNKVDDKPPAPEDLKPSGEDGYEEQRLRRKCKKLHALVKEQKSTIESLRNKRYQPSVVEAEALRNVHKLAQEERQDAMGLNSWLSGSEKRVRKQESVDERLHKYELHVQQLYKEIKEKKEKYNMLEECLQQEKHKKRKLIKACKAARHALLAVQQDGTRDMLEDMKGKYANLEKEHESLKLSLEAEREETRSKADEITTFQETVSSLRAEKEELQQSMERQGDAQSRLRQQVQEQQSTIRQLQEDYQAALERTQVLERQNGRTQDDNTHETLSVALANSQEKIAQLKEEIQTLRSDQTRIQQRLPTTCDTTELPTEASPTRNFDQLSYQSEQVGKKLVLLYRWLTNESSAAFSTMNKKQTAPVKPIRSDTDIQECLRGFESTLEELQQLVEDRAARTLGAQLALSCNLKEAC